MDNYLRLSVHQLVDFLLRSGDIDNRVFNRSSMSGGSRLQSIKQQGSNYLSEVFLSTHIYIDEMDILLEGRADGIIHRGGREYVIDEIKTTVEDLKLFHSQNLEWHLGQAKCYAYMFAKANNLEYIGVKLTYIRKEKKKSSLSTRIFRFLIPRTRHPRLDKRLYSFIALSCKNEQRNESIKTCFPFKNYRAGQRELVKYAYAITKKEADFCRSLTELVNTLPFPIYQSN